MNHDAKTITHFQSNMINIYGERGQAWLDELPQLIQSLSLKFSLRDLKEVTHLSHHAVLSGFQDHTPIILKLGLDHQALEQEGFILKCFSGCGVVKVLTQDRGVLLLERAIPGTSLRSHPVKSEEESIKIAWGCIQKLHQAKIPQLHSTPHIHDWLTPLNQDWNIPSVYLKKARRLSHQLLKSTSLEVLLHGDLHHDQILKSGDDWVVIDPKGVIGEPAYEVGAFIRNPIPEILNEGNKSEIIQARIQVFAHLLELPPQRILDWSLVQAVLCWVWALEDSLDPAPFEQLSKVFDAMRV